MLRVGQIIVEMVLDEKLSKTSGAEALTNLPRLLPHRVEGWLAVDRQSPMRKVVVDAQGVFMRELELGDMLLEDHA